jgi:nucleoside phosphorylase
MAAGAKPYEESVAEACAAILEHLSKERDAPKRDLLLTDFANRVRKLPDEVADPLRMLALQSCLPGGDERPGIGELIRVNSRAPKAVDVVITTVTAMEWRALTDVFEVDQAEPENHSGRLYHERTLPCGAEKQDVTVAITSIMEPLNVPAAKAVSEIRQFFEGRMYFLLGIAAGRRAKLSLGDVVVPQAIHYYPPSRRRPGKIEPRPAHKEMRKDLQRNITYYDPNASGFYERLADGIVGFAARYRPDDLKEGYRPTIVADKAVIASGEQLIQDGLLDELQDRFDEQVMAGDQEAFGFAEGLDAQPWMIFRGISDYGEDPKPHDWQYLAAYTAGLALRDYIETTFVFPELATDF